MARQLFPLLAVALVGCGSNVSKNPDPIEVTGTVAFANGKPVTDVVLNFQPVADGGQAFALVRNGEFKGTVMPGRYTYYFSEARGASPVAFRAIPEKYHAGAMDRTVEIKPGVTPTLTVE